VLLVYEQNIKMDVEQNIKMDVEGVGWFRLGSSDRLS
jgi:hypothetical protein